MTIPIRQVARCTRLTQRCFARPAIVEAAARIVELQLRQLLTTASSTIMGYHAPHVVLGRIPSRAVW